MIPVVRQTPVETPTAMHPHISGTATDGQQESAFSHDGFDPDLLPALFDGGNWFHFFRPLYKLLKKTEAVLLQDLMNLANVSKRDGGFFLCTVQYLENKEWSKKEQETHLTSLKNKGYLEIEKRGIPGRRWIKIRYGWLKAELIRIGVIKMQLPPSRGNCPPREGGGTNNRTTKTIHSPARPGGGAALPEREKVVGKKGLFPELDSRTVKGRRDYAALTPYDTCCAKALYDAVKGKGKLDPRGHSLKDWAYEFHLLTEKIGQDTDRVDRVLDWYAANLFRDQYVPVVRSAASFRAKFQALEAAQERDARKFAVEREREGVSKESLEIVQKYLKKYRWPKGSDKDLPLAVERSLQAHRKLRKAYAAYEPVADGRMRGLHAHLRHKLFGKSEDFVVRWFEAVFENVSDWAAWSGNLLALAFDPGGEQFQRAGRAAADSYAGKPHLWDDYWEELKALL